MARVHVETWREAYRGLMSDEILDDPGFVERRERLWSTALADEWPGRNRIAVADSLDGLVGIAMSGPPMDDDTAATRQLYVLYVFRAHYGSGVGQVLLDAVTDAGETTCLWVADPNPRAQEFYRRNGFAPDGVERIDDGVREIRMLRPSRS
ncbi:GNAT family N-acetyltransferase [Microbacter sp. GSS18]|nr:GNAT family N-acetyltransferase [Microbacter sp. GSS18]